MAAHGKFSQSGPFRALLAEFVIESSADGQLLLVHNTCAADVCWVEVDDSMDVLVQTVIDHDC